MTATEGRAPRPFLRSPIFRWARYRWALVAVLGIGAVAASLHCYGPCLVDRYGYERFYSRQDPDGRRVQLERKRVEWWPGDPFRCVVVERDGSRRYYAVTDEPDAEPEQRIRAALRERPGD